MVSLISRDRSLNAHSSTLRTVWIEDELQHGLAALKHEAVGWRSFHPL